MTCGDSVGTSGTGQWVQAWSSPHTPRSPPIVLPMPGGRSGVAAGTGAGESVQSEVSGVTHSSRGPMQGWGGVRPGPRGEQAPSLSSSGLCGVGDAATTAPPSLPPLFFGRGHPLSMAAALQRMSPGRGHRGRAKACVCPQVPQNFGGESQGIPAAGPPHPRCAYG